MRASDLRMCTAAWPRAAGAADRNAGVALFDGKTLNGWKQLGGAADYQVIDGAIVGATRPGVPNSFLVTQQDFADFILEFDVRQDVGPANSGVQFRSHSTPEFENGRVHGYQADIDPSPRQWSGHIYEEAQRGWFYTGEMNPPSKALYKFGAWNHYRIEAIGPRLRVWVNDGAAADVIDAGSASGIHRPAGAFDRQARRSRSHHQLEESLDPDPRPRAASRDGHLHPQQPAQQPAPGRKGPGLAPAVGWQDCARAGAARRQRDFRRRDGRWPTASSRCSRKAGGGDIMSDEEFGAFELQLEFKVSAGANSGIFYLLTSPRDPASDAPLGLEYQILDDERHPDAKLGSDGNRTLASLYDVLPRAKLMTNVGIAPKIDVWQHARIVSRADGTVEHWLNGVKVLEFNRHSADYRAQVAASKFKSTPGFGARREGPHPAAGSRRRGGLPQHQDPLARLRFISRRACALRGAPQASYAVMARCAQGFGACRIASRQWFMASSLAIASMFGKRLSRAAAIARS